MLVHYHRVLLFITLLTCLLLSSCATFSSKYLKPELSLVNIEMLDSTGLEQNFELQLRIQNPNDIELPIKGISYQVSLFGEQFASGVSDQAFSLRPFSEQLVTFKLNTNLLQAGKTILKLLKNKQSILSYSMKAKIHTDKFLLGTIPVQKSGQVNIETFFKP